MQLTQTSIEKTFVVKHRGKEYYVNYVNSDGQTLALLNRFNWEVFDENNESVMPLLFKHASKKERDKYNRDSKLVDALIEFCAKKFNEYTPEI